MVIEVDTKSEEWKYEKYPGAVLLGDHIKYWVKRGELIVDGTFILNHLKRAKYDVSLGKMYFKNGNYGILDESLPSTMTLSIEPYELVFVESYEIFKIPKNIVAVYDLRVKCCLGGLGLQTGLQLDPEYHGRIFCPLFNFTDTPVKLDYKEHLASVQFIYTTLSNEDVEKITSCDRNDLMSLSEALDKKPPLSGLKDLYDKINKTNTDVVSKIKEIDEYNKRIDILDTKIENFTRTNFSAMAFVVGALSVMAAAIAIAVTRSTPGSDLAVAIGTGIIVFVIGVLIIIQMIFHKKNNIS
jgi:deoxycytidine triphosphate deaminase